MYGQRNYGNNQGPEAQHHLPTAFPPLPSLWQQLNISFLPPFQAAFPPLPSLGQLDIPFVPPFQANSLGNPSYPLQHYQLLQPPPGRMMNTTAHPLQPSCGGMPMIAGPYRNLHVGTCNFQHFPTPSPPPPPPPPPPPAGPSNREFNDTTCETNSLTVQQKRKEKLKEKRKQKRIQKKRRIKEYVRSLKGTKAEDRTETHFKTLEKIKEWREKRKMRSRTRVTRRALFSSTSGKPSDIEKNICYEH